MSLVRCGLAIRAGFKLFQSADKSLGTASTATILVGIDVGIGLRVLQAALSQL